MHYEFALCIMNYELIITIMHYELKKLSSMKRLYNHHSVAIV